MKHEHGIELAICFYWTVIKCYESAQIRVTTEGKAFLTFLIPVLEITILFPGD